MSKPGDPRLIDLFVASSEENRNNLLKVTLVGYPCDMGVVRNGGRPGACDGPKVIWERLPKLGPLVNPEFNIDIRNLNIVDRGNIPVTSSLEKTHVNLTNAVQKCCDDGYVVIVVGGGNDQSYCNAKGLMKSLGNGNIGVVNIDAHFDVRPLIDGDKAHSGSPFRQLLNDDQFSSDVGKFCEFAIQGNQSSAEHARFIQEKGGEICWLSQVREKTKEKFKDVLRSFEDRPTFVSFDIDSIRRADCPGVSCPAAIGLSAQDALDICFAAGQHKETRMLDLSEFNPHVEKYDTSTLVCTMIYYFLMGLSTR